MPIESRTVCPALNALTMVQIIFPLTDVLLFAILRLESSKSICLVILPITLICVSVGTPELSLSVCLIVEPLALILGLVWPALHPIGALFAFFVDVARVVRFLKHLDVFHVLQVVLFNHFL